MRRERTLSRNFATKFLVDFFVDDETLRRDTRLSRVDHAGLDASVDGGLQIRCRHDDERIASAELENGFLDLSRRSAGHVDPGPLAAGQRYCFYARVVN